MIDTRELVELVEKLAIKNGQSDRYAYQAGYLGGLLLTLGAASSVQDWLRNNVNWLKKELGEEVVELSK